MDGTRFDRLTRGLSGTRTRRGVLVGLATGLGLAVGAPGATWAKNKNKHNRNKKKLKRNRFGCVDVGKPCRGRDTVCCSGICQGKKPKKGKEDKSECVAHHVGTCTPADDACAIGGGPSCNPDLPFSACFRTTGKASFCGNDVINGCIECRKDADCQGIGQGAACVVCPGCAAIYGFEATCRPPGTA